MPTRGLLNPFPGPEKKSFSAVFPTGKPLKLHLSGEGWKGACLVQESGFVLCGVRREGKGEGFFLSRGKWIHRSNPQEVGPGGGLVCLGADGKGNQGEVDSGKQSAGSGAWGWACLPGGRRKRKSGRRCFCLSPCEEVGFFLTPNRIAGVIPPQSDVKRCPSLYLLTLK